MTFLSFSSSAEAYVFATCVFLGIAMLMPLNALTSAPRYMVDYYKYATGDPDAVPNSTLFWSNILTFYNLASVPTQAICGPTVLLPVMRRLSLTLRFVLSLSLMMLEVLVVVLMPVGHVSQTGAMVAFFIVTIAAGAGKSYLEATCYAMVGTMPPKFMSAVMFGCGFSGVVASVLQCIIKASMDDTYISVLHQSYIYFSLALGFMAVALAMALCLRYNSFAQKYVGEFRVASGQVEVAEFGLSPSAGDLEGLGGDEPAAADVVLDAEASPEQKLNEKENALTSDSDDNEVRVVREPLGDLAEESVSSDKNLTTVEQMQRTRIWPIVKLIWPMQLTCFTIFFVSLLILPSLIIPVDREDNWFSTIAILLYNCGDAAGRLSTSLRVLWVPRKVVSIVAGLRLLFLPLIFLCIYGYIPGHAPPYVFMALIGATNGFFGALTMVYGPQTRGLRTEGQKVMAGQLMGISLLAGASLAALLAMVIVLFLP